MTSDYDGILAYKGATLSHALVRNGTASDNKLGGTVHNDSFRGAGGADLLLGYDGHDTYSFGRGHGLDTIIDHSPEGSRIRFFGTVDPASVSISEIPGWNGETDRLIRYGKTDAIRIVGWSRLPQATRDAWSIEYIAPPPRREVPLDIKLWRLSAYLPSILFFACLLVTVFWIRSLRR